ncbi:RNA polymerase sigma factor [Nannocystis pusilla]|uniref:Sigma-70 family RNA polymerase sigma factor n=1 Tax=Nannocystis pusilla TaxID=889268 RepID=A0ABS7TNQ2_9BACT|nr:sigma-70 family RNA polymerase sigma factor [Nannocystis pusilla]MBZ5709772.1 sigma-70 family RNA polymerase sigma factor [Nannocystis pusilla]
MAIDVQETYKRHGPMVLRRCRSLLHDEQQAVDAMHDVFVQLLVHRERLVDKGACSLLWRIATNVCLNKIRSRRRRPEDPQSELLAEIAAHDDAESRGVARVVLDRLFAREPVSTGTMAVMHLVDGMTLEEVAESVGLSVSGVRKRLRTLRAGVMAREGAA